MKNEKYSHGDFTNQTFLGVDTAEFSNMQIFGSNFYQEGSGRVQVFPDSSTGITFTDCNIDNVVLPPNSILSGTTTNKRIHKQTNGIDYFCDEDGIPTEPLPKQTMIDLGLSIDVGDLPETPLEGNVITTKLKELAEA